MKPSFKLLLLLICGVSLKSVVVNFKELLYHEICDPEVIESPDIYEATEMFNHLFFKIAKNENINLEEVKDNFTKHYNLLKGYMDDMEKIKKLMTGDSLKT